MSKKRERLVAYMEQRVYCRFESPFEPGFSHGYVLDVGPRLFLFLLVSDSLRFDGFECYRIADVRRLRVDPYARFAEEALRLQKQGVKTKPNVDLSSMEALLGSVAKLADLVAIDRAEVKAGVCWIGKLQRSTDGRFGILEIGPDAEWDSEPTQLELNEITRVGWGGAYENALKLVSDDRASKKAKARLSNVRSTPFLMEGQATADPFALLRDDKQLLDNRRFGKNKQSAHNKQSGMTTRGA